MRGECTRGAVEVGSRQETELGGAVEIKGRGIGQAGGGNGVPGAAVIGGVFPGALRCGGGVGGDGDASEGVAVGIGVGRGKEGGHGVASRSGGVF